MTAQHWKVSALLFFSGFSALVYQTVWMREFRLIFGVSTYATAAVLAIFMAGLGAGSAILGRRVDSRTRPLAFYARLEFLIAAAAAASILLLIVAAKLYFATGGSPRLGLTGATFVRLLLATIVIGPATFLMGGTLPAAARSIESADDAGRRAVALLYGINTLGAVAGTLLANFRMIETIGNRMTLLLAVLVNLLVAFRAAAMARSMDEPEPDRAGSASAESVAADAAAPHRFIYASAAIVGFAFLLMELVWYRMLSPILGGTTYMFGLVLAMALLGIGAGGAAYALMRRSTQPGLGAFALTCAAEAVAIATPFALGDSLALFAGVLRTWGTIAGFGGHVLSWAIVTFVVVFPAAFIAGVQFPLLIGLLGRGRENVGRQVGALYAWNTVGAIAGSLAGGFGLIPLLSAPVTWQVVAAILAALSLVSVVFSHRERASWRVPITVAAAAVTVALLFAEGPTATWRHAGIGVGRMPKFPAANDAHDWSNHFNRAVQWERDGRESSVAMNHSEQVTFVVNGKTDGSARFDAATQVTLGLIGSILHPNPKSAMVVGLGTGSTAGWLGAVPSIERVDVVELEPVILDVARACTAVNAGAMTNPKVHVQIGDAREFLLTTDRRYDVIASEPSNPYRAGIASLLTRDFYEAIDERLNEGGILVQWLQVYGVDAGTLRTVYATVRSVFPHVQTWWTTGGDLALVASKKALIVDADVLRTRLASEPYSQAFLNTWRVDSVEGFLARMVANEAFAAQASGEAVLNTDDRTVIEYGFARSVNEAAVMGEQLTKDSRATGTTRPVSLRGRVDWNELERLRPWSDELQEKLPVDSMNATETNIVAAAQYATGMMTRQPADAAFILARVRVLEKKPDEAVALLLRGFEVSRRDPWGDPIVLQSAIELAVKLSRVNDEYARQMHDALVQPFVVAMQESRRKHALIAIAPLVDQCGPATLAALHGVEPWPFWNQQMLVIRANCYAIARDPLAEEAWRDLARFVAAEPAPILTPQPSRAPRGPS